MPSRRCIRLAISMIFYSSRVVIYNKRCDIVVVDLSISLVSDIFKLDEWTLHCKTVCQSSKGACGKGRVSQALSIF